MNHRRALRKIHGSQRRAQDDEDQNAGNLHHIFVGHELTVNERWLFADPTYYMDKHMVSTPLDGSAETVGGLSVRAVRKGKITKWTDDGSPRVWAEMSDEELRDQLRHYVSRGTQSA